MARRISADRREPSFDLLDREEEAGFRVHPEDRPAAPMRERTRPPRPQAPQWDTDDGEPPPRAPRRRGGNGGGRNGNGGIRRRKKRRGGSSILGRLIYWAFVLAIWGFLAAVAIIAWYAAHLPPMSELEVPDRPPNIAIIGTTGEVMVNRGAMGQAIKLKALPKYLPQAVMAIEDRRFYHHYGVDPIGILRAMSRNIIGRGLAEGGSTITQQLAKNIFLTREKTMGRKIQEAILAFWLEARYSKDEILEMYLNRVYLGAGAFGVEGAAQRYFGKSAKNVTLQEAAVLAGLLQAPSRFAPTRDPEQSMARARVVLGAMVQAGYITELDAKIAGTAPLKVHPGDPAGNSIQYAADWVMDLLPSMIGTVDTDIIVETTIDPNLQREAEKALREALDKDGGKYQVSQGAVVTIDVNGAVRALIGGRSYQDSQYNRAITSRRQPGSAFKPFVYLAALERGLTPDTVRDDAPINIRGWTPENFDHKNRGPVSLRDALALSLNTVAARLGQEVGPQAVVRTAERLGISSPLQAIPSIALGTSEVSVLELTRAYVPFANGGALVTPYVVKSIRTAKGRVLFQHLGDPGGRVIRPEHVAMMDQMLGRAVEIGTAHNARLPGWTVAGKTGTSQDFRDAWFVGFSAQMVTGVWLGNDDGTPMKRTTGGSLPTSIWSRVMAMAHQGLPPLALPGAGQSFGAPPQGQPTRSIDDILMGPAPSANQSPNFDRPATTSGACPLTGDFLRCVFGAR